MTGIVIWYNPAKGYGFIRPDEGGGDVFVHRRDISEIPRDLTKSQLVVFDLVPNQFYGRHTVKAANVRSLKAAP